MSHVTFIHGILNKPPADALLNIWNQALAVDGGIELATNGVSSSMVYWADVLYAHPDAAAAHESVDGLPEGDQLGVEFPWMKGLGGQEREVTNSLLVKLDRSMAAVLPGEPEPSPAEAAATVAGVTLERIPLPWPVKRAVMEALLRDVHHYLFNSTSEPRPGERYRVQDEIRRRFVERLKADRPESGKHVVVSHSMGTVIAYDCLKRVPDCPPIDALFTLGSPLGIDEVRDLLQPGWTPATPIAPGWSSVDSFPSAKLNGPWYNDFDRLDPVAATAPSLASYYMKGGVPLVHDAAVDNGGWWRHDLNKYFARTELREPLRAVLDL